MAFRRATGVENNIQFRSVASGRIFLASETAVQRTVSDEGNSIDRLGSVEPGIYSRRRVDDYIIALRRLSKRHAGSNGSAQCRREA
jgi:hypothetical protein